MEDKNSKIKSYVSKLKPTIGGKFLYYFIPYRKKVVLENMNVVFSNILTQQEIIKLAKSFYSHLFTSLKEILLMKFQTLKQIKNKAVIIGEENLRNLEKTNEKGAIIITGHFGNCELAPLAGILNYQYLRNRFYFIRKNLVNKFIEKATFKRYYKAGLGVIPKKNSLEKVCHVLENYGAVVFVMDQHASVKAKDGIMVDFFGKKASTFKSPAMITSHTKVPVLPARSYRRPDGKHVVEFGAPLTWLTGTNSQEEIEINTRQYNEVLENYILEYPEQWLWIHRRWKNT